jgi:phosphocarrier protein FPr
VTVNLVIVSHSAQLAEGTAELARQMGGDEVAIEPAGGLDDGSIGTDAERVRAAIERVRSPDGVLVLMDLGSALMSAEIAVELLEDGGGPVALSAAPLVEGAVAAAARARGGAELAEVAAEARGALVMKTSQLEEEDAPESSAAAVSESDALVERLRVSNRLGLHVRPAGRIIELVAGHDATVELRNATRGTGPADGRSLTALAMLRAGQGDELEVAASGPQARELLAALVALAAANFGDAPDAPASAGSPAPTATQSAAPPESSPAAAAPPGPGDVLRGVTAVRGLAIGPARWSARAEFDLDAVVAGSPDEEARRLSVALDAARGQLAATAARLPPGEAEIFEAQTLLLDDAALIDPARAAVAAGEPAALAFKRAADDVAAGFDGIEDPYLQARAIDIRDVAGRVLAELVGTSARAPVAPGIIVADELTPGAVADLDPATAWGIATARGGTLGHAAIVAGALGIPLIVGVGPALLSVAEGVTLALDGDDGAVTIEPDAATTATFERRREANAAERAEALATAAEPVVLSDGRHVEIFANIGNAGDARLAVSQGAEGVGLLRTEFLFHDRATPPSEDEQVAALTEIAEALGGRPLIVRTLDAGADKPLPFLPIEPEANPFLGRRGIRLSLDAPDLFSTQLRAILRVAAEHPLSVMFPMVSTVAELQAARTLLDAAREQLSSTAQLEVGAMIEVPAAALMAEQFAPHLDFFSIGTNDLSQYTMAAERGNPALAGLLQAALEPVLTLIASVTAAAEAHGRWVGVCGELAGDPDVALRLVSLGVRELSMAPARIPAVKAHLRGAEASSLR